MNRRSFILVFPSEALWLMGDARPLAGALETDDVIYALDGNIVFISTDQHLEQLLDRLRSVYFSDQQFFLADISEAARAGNMSPVFWNRFSMKATHDVAA